MQDRNGTKQEVSPEMRATIAAMEKLRNVDLEETAYHEAGHAVLACAIGKPPLWMKMGSEEHSDSVGQTKLPRILHLIEYQRNTEISVTEALMAYSAGHIAEAMYLRSVGIDVDKKALLRAARGDFQKITKVFRNRDLLFAGTSFLDDDRAATMMRVQEATEKLLTANWGRVKTVAKSLLHFRRLSRRQIVFAYDKGASA